MGDSGRALPADLAEFFESGVSILVATRDAALRRACIRGAGASVRGADGVVTVYLPQAMAARTLANVLDNGQIAVTFWRPLTHQSIQIKGTCSATRASTEEAARFSSVTIDIEGLQRCFQEIVPAMVATCALDGTPNVTYLSHVYYLDAKHVALSRQFLNKTSKNIEENPYACVQLLDPLTIDAYELDLRFDHSETSGKLFDTMALRIEAIASHTGMVGIFKLIAADVYEVIGLRPLPEAVSPPAPDAADDPAPTSLRGELRALQVISQRMSQAGDLEGLLASLLAALDAELGFAHSVVLLLDESGQTFYTVASHGYEDDGGIGAEVAIGEGLIGMVGRERRILRLSDVDGDMRYGRAIRREVRSTLGGKALRPEIPLQGLPKRAATSRSPCCSPTGFSACSLSKVTIPSPSRHGTRRSWACLSGRRPPASRTRCSAKTPRAPPAQRRWSALRASRRGRAHSTSTLQTTASSSTAST